MSRYPVHGKRRVWWAPWRTRCACGLDAYPCAVLLWRRGVVAARGWQAEERLSAPAIPTPRCYGTFDVEDGTCGWRGPHGEHPVDVEPPRQRRSAEA